MLIFKNSYTKVISALIAVIFFANSAIVYAIEIEAYRRKVSPNVIFLRVPSSFSQSSANNNRIKESLDLLNANKAISDTESKGSIGESLKRHGLRYPLYAYKVGDFCAQSLNFLFTFFILDATTALQNVQAFGRTLINNRLHAKGYELSERNGNASIKALMSYMLLRLALDKQFHNEMQRLITLKGLGGKSSPSIWMKRLMHPDAIRNPGVLFDKIFQDLWDGYLSLAAFGDVESVFRLKDLIGTANDVGVINKNDENKRFLLHCSLRDVNVKTLSVKVNKGDLLALEALKFLASDYSNIQAKEVLEALEKQGQKTLKPDKGRAVAFNKIKIIKERLIPEDLKAGVFLKIKNRLPRPKQLIRSL